MPGHLLRRAQQHHTAIWADAVGAEPTGPQYAVLAALETWPGSDQRRVGALASLDRTSTTQVVRRLAGRGLLARGPHPRDGRRDALTLTDAARADLPGLHERVRVVQEGLLAPLGGADRQALVGALATVARVAGTGAAADHAPLTVPGHLLRRAQQVHTSLFADALGRSVTGPQYAVLRTLTEEPGLGQRDLGERLALDRSTTADLVARLERRGWLVREQDPADGRRRVLVPTPEALAAVPAWTPRVLEVQDAVLAPLPQAERGRFVDLLRAVARTA
ncbi:MarR family transcriptional regulator [Phycicoccus sp. CSK15P-2]|uniref:MarR family winged helix-turn-helix transcriptional regulator n=1 Tax=Phycicoccus sp. CSK15P-2 TaxID=2807627 RepID=UPI001951D2D6|nr:MarR family transcriptional regulator [Phycicoccus sp. CSK15P-2]MBM6403181.1 MarR family transcriptional regulator [Phycicoccus sp. CSK15P-2]